MDSHLLIIFLTLGLMVVLSHGALSPQLYWKSVLPNTPIPKSIRDDLENKNTKWVATNPKSNPSVVDISYGGRQAYKLGAVESQSLSDILNIGYRGRGAYKIGMDKKSFLNNLDSLNVGYGGRDAYSLGKDTTELQLRLANPKNINLYFLEKDIKEGNTMTLDFSTNPSTKSAKFLSRREAENVPFSSEKLPEILKRFSVKPGSVEAQTLENTLKDLERPSTKGQVDFVATSLESMVDFVNSKIGVEGVGGERGLEVGSSEVEVEVEVGGREVEIEIPIGQYTVMSGTSKILSENSQALVCHKQKYPYAVFYCHGLPTTRAYMVPLAGANGIKVKALALCHIDTSEWNPYHFAFKMLKIKRGTTPVCHFLPEDHVVWVGKN